jgi:hypothetical protein
MGKFTKFLKGCDLFDNEFKFFVSYDKNTFKSTFGGIMTIIYIISLIYLAVFCIYKYFTSLPEIDIYNDVELSIEGEYDTNNFNTVSDLMNMKLIDKYGRDYHRLYVYSKYQNKKNKKIIKRIEVLRPNTFDSYNINFNVSILNEVEILSLKIFYSTCEYIKKLKPDKIENEDLLKNCNFNITEFLESMKRNNSLNETVIISFNTHKVSINPFVQEKYSYDSNMQIDFVPLNYIKSKNLINFKWYYFKEIHDFVKNTSFAIDLDYEVGYPVFINNTEHNQGYLEEFTININKQKNFVHFKYMSLLETCSLFGGMFSLLTTVVTKITNFITKNDVQIYKMIKEFKKQSNSSKSIKLKNEVNEGNDNNLNETLNNNCQINNTYIDITNEKLNEKDTLFKNYLDKFKKGHLSFSCFRFYACCCCKRNDERIKMINYIKDSFSILNLQKRLNELEIIKYLLLKGDEIKKIREINKLSNLEINSVRFMDFQNDNVDSIMNYVKSKIP